MSMVQLHLDWWRGVGGYKCSPSVCSVSGSGSSFLETSAGAWLLLCALQCSDAFCSLSAPSSRAYALCLCFLWRLFPVSLCWSPLCLSAQQAGKAG